MRRRIADLAIRWLGILAATITLFASLLAPPGYGGLGVVDRRSLRVSAISARFRDASAHDVIKMWETGKNEQGRKLDRFEFAGLVER